MDIVAASDIIFLCGSSIKGAILYPTLVDDEAYVPWSTSIPTMLIWFVFATTYYALGMSLGALATYAGGIMWLLVVVYRGDSVSDFSIKRNPISILPPRSR